MIYEQALWGNCPQPPSRIIHRTGISGGLTPVFCNNIHTFFHITTVIDIFIDERRGRVLSLFLAPTDRTITLHLLG